MASSWQRTNEWLSFGLAYSSNGDRRGLSLLLSTILLLSFALGFFPLLPRLKLYRTKPSAVQTAMRLVRARTDISSAIGAGRGLG
jgi:hypothetical protein